MKYSRAGYQESILGALCIFWAVWLIVFDTYHVSTILAALRNWSIPQILILIWLFVCGVGLLTLSSCWRKNIHFLMFAFWIFIVCAIAETSITPIALPAYFAIALIHAGYGITLN